MSATKACDVCGRPFDLGLPGYVCPACKYIIKPEDERNNMSQNCKEKKCVGYYDAKANKNIECGKAFTATCNVQKRCPECITLHKKNYSIKYKAKHQAMGSAKSYTVPTDKNPEKIHLGSDAIVYTEPEDTLILRMLVAIGLVSKEKIQQAREIFRKLKS